MNQESSKDIVDGCMILYSQALKLTRDSEQASDLVQDTTLKALLFYKNFKQGTNLNAWLYVIMRNIFINGYRKRIKEQEVIQKHLLPANQPHSGLARPEEAAGKFILADIDKAIRLLPGQQGEIFVKYCEGFKYDEIAAEFKVPIGTIKTRIFKARERLRKQLRAYN